MTRDDTKDCFTVEEIQETEPRSQKRKSSLVNSLTHDSTGLLPPGRLRAEATATASIKTAALLTVALIFLAMLSCAGVSSALYFYDELQYIEFLLSSDSCAPFIGNSGEPTKSTHLIITSVITIICE